MISVIQRVKQASVIIDGEIYSNIGHGLLILFGVCKGDPEEYADYFAKKITGLRIFTDDTGKMNLSISDTGGEILVVSQFTLCSDKAKSGNRPSFINAELPERAEKIYNRFIESLNNIYLKNRIKTGVFAAVMEVSLINNGPVTIILEK